MKKALFSLLAAAIAAAVPVRAIILAALAALLLAAPPARATTGELPTRFGLDDATQYAVTDADARIYDGAVALAGVLPGSGTPDDPYLISSAELVVLTARWTPPLPAPGVRVRHRPGPRKNPPTGLLAPYGGCGNLEIVGPVEPGDRSPMGSSSRSRRVDPFPKTSIVPP